MGMSMGSGNPISGEGLPNPAPNVTANWGELPAGREWGSTAGVDIDPTDGQVWAYERCGAGSFGAGVPINCDNNPVDPVFKFDRETGAVLANFGGGLMVVPHGIHADEEGNVWVTDFAGNQEGTKGHQVFKFSPDGELLLTLGTAGQAGSGPNQLNQPNDVIVAPDGSIFVADGHADTTNNRVVKFDAEGNYLMEWGTTGYAPGEFRTLHGIAIDNDGRLFIADRSNNRVQIFDQEGNFLTQWLQFGRPSGITFDAHGRIYVADSESDNVQNPGFELGIRIGDAKSGWVDEFIPFVWGDPREVAGNGAEFVAVDAEGNIYGGEPRPRNLQKYVRVRP